MKEKIRFLAERSFPDVLEKIKESQEYQMYMQKNNKKSFFWTNFRVKLATSFSLVLILFLALLILTNQNNDVFALEYTSNGYHIQVNVNENGDILEIIPLNNETQIMFNEKALPIDDESFFETKVEWQMKTNHNVPENIRENLNERMNNARERLGNPNENSNDRRPNQPNKRP